jgi:hypothetical protein
MKMAAMAMLDIVAAGIDNRRAHSTGRSGEHWIADAVQDIVAMVPCSEARHLVPDGRGLDAGNFAVVDGMHLASPRYTDLTPVTGKPRCTRLHHIGRMGALIPYCA